MNKVVGSTVNGVVFVRGSLNNVNAMAWELEALGYDFTVKTCASGRRANFTAEDGKVLARVFDADGHSAHIARDVWDAIVAKQ